MRNAFVNNFPARFNVDGAHVGMDWPALEAAGWSRKSDCSCEIPCEYTKGDSKAFLTDGTVSGIHGDSLQLNREMVLAPGTRFSLDRRELFLALCLPLLHCELVLGPKLPLQRITIPAFGLQVHFQADTVTNFVLDRLCEFDPGRVCAPRDSDH